MSYTHIPGTLYKPDKASLNRLNPITKGLVAAYPITQDTVLYSAGNILSGNPNRTNAVLDISGYQNHLTMSAKSNNVDGFWGTPGRVPDKEGMSWNFYSTGSLTGEPGFFLNSIPSSLKGQQMSMFWAGQLMANVQSSSGFGNVIAMVTYDTSSTDSPFQSYGLCRAPNSASAPDRVTFINSVGGTNSHDQNGVTGGSKYQQFLSLGQTLQTGQHIGYVNGSKAFIDTSHTGTIQYTSSSKLLINSPGGSGYDTGNWGSSYTNMYALYIWNRILSGDEMATLHADPMCLLDRKTSLKRYFLAGTPVTHTLNSFNAQSTVKVLGNVHSFNAQSTVTVGSAGPLYKWRPGPYIDTSSNFANQVIMLGGADSSGDEITSTANDLADQTTRGRVIAVAVPNRTITNQATLDLAAQVELDNRAIQTTLTFDFDKDGSNVGETVQITSGGMGINGNFIIQSLEMTQRDNVGACVYTAQVGSYSPTFKDRIKQLALLSNPTLLPPAIPADGSITDDKIVSVDASKITSQLVASQIDTVNFSSVVGPISISATDITGGINFGTQITGSTVNITSSMISSVSFSSITGTVTVAAGNITGSINFSQVDSTTVSISNSQLAGSINFTKLDNSTVNITHSNITSIDATTITVGSIVDSQISTVNVSKLVAGSASFSGTVTLTHTGGGAGTLSLSSTGVSLTGGGFTFTLDSGGLFCTGEIASGGAIAAGSGLSGGGLSITGTALITGLVTSNVGFGVAGDNGISSTITLASITKLVVLGGIVIGTI